jgi:hypothetical protein
LAADYNRRHQYQILPCWYVGTPNLESRILQLKHQLSRVNVVDEQVVNQAVKSYSAFLDSVWSGEAMFINYLEGLQLASAFADIVASKKELGAANMSTIFSKQAAVMTVRGPAREEYISSMGMYRF